MNFKNKKNEEGTYQEKNMDAELLTDNNSNDNLSDYNDKCDRDNNEKNKCHCKKCSDEENKNEE